MKSELSEEYLDLLGGICKSSKGYIPSDLDEIALSNLSSAGMDMLCEAISNEFILNGLNEDFEPNEYGRKLENFLDFVNGFRLRGG